MISVRIEGEDSFIATFDSLGQPESVAQEIRGYCKLVSSDSEAALTGAASGRALTILRATNDVTVLGPPYDDILRQSGLFSAISTLVKVLVAVQSPTEEKTEQVDQLVHYASETLANCSQATRSPKLTAITVQLSNGRTVHVRAAPLSYAQVETAGLFWAASFVLGLFVGHVSFDGHNDQGMVVQAPIHMVELGCGTGAASLIAAGFLAQCHRAAEATLSATLSDFPSVVAQAMVNVGLNYSGADSQVQFKALSLDLLSPTQAQTTEGETLNPILQSTPSGGFQVLLLSDMFYSIPLMPHVLRWAKFLLSIPQKGYPSDLDKISPMEAAKILFRRCASDPSGHGGLILASTTTFRDGMPLLESLVNEHGLTILACVPAQEFLMTELATSCRPGLVQAARITDYRIYILGHKC